MNLDNELRIFARQFASLNVNRNRGASAPHKPLMLLSVLDLIEERAIQQNRIEYSDRLVERFNEYWNLLRPVGFQSRPWLPFFHLRSDEFWLLIPNSGSDSLSKMRSPKSHHDIRQSISHVALITELWDLLQSEPARETLRLVLLQTYFEVSKHEDFYRLIKIGKETNLYMGKLLRRATIEPFRLHYENPGLQFKQSVIRDRAFRQLIRRLYNESCCICNLRIVTDVGHSIIEAAHIVPYSSFFNDDPRNGLGLCPVHHWCFDKGLISLSPEYRIVVSDRLSSERPTEVRLIEFNGKDAILPFDKALRPASDALRYHSEKFGIAV